MRALAIGGGLLGLVLVVGIVAYVMVGGSREGTGPGGGPAGPGQIGAMIDARDRSAANVAVATVRQRLQAHHAAHGAYPASLEEVGPLPALPREMKYKYDPATGSVEAE